eukprot:CAMPEP_0194290430 /NCGR_PEP_ID=MMETSP0169-20130528/41216_1 /TAXON_ID=218684 /ORGANISM="Corethron pennatum, Strain L29A3" /LENGTH=994 /DNA_ID=CAMNT_0039038003 /DNA_START=243 /DNA_END=3224 /DNA_ORIENTATION=-
MSEKHSDSAAVLTEIPNEVPDDDRSVTTIGTNATALSTATNAEHLWRRKYESLKKKARQFAIEERNKFVALDNKLVQLTKERNALFDEKEIRRNDAEVALTTRIDGSKVDYEACVAEVNMSKKCVKERPITDEIKQHESGLQEENSHEKNMLLEVRINEMKSEIVRLREDNKNKNISLQQREKDFVEINSQFLEEKMVQQDKLTFLQNKLKLAEDQFKMTRSDMAIEKTEKKKLNIENAKLKKDLSQSTSKKSTLEKKLDEQQTASATRNDENVKIISSLKAQLTDVKQKQKSSCTEFDSTKNVYESRLKELESKLGAGNRSISSLEKTNTKLKEESSEMSKIIETKNKEIATLNTVIDEVSTNMQNQMTVRAEAENKVKELENKLLSIATPASKLENNSHVNESCEIVHHDTSGMENSSDNLPSASNQSNKKKSLGATIDEVKSVEVTSIFFEERPENVDEDCGSSDKNSSQRKEVVMNQHDLLEGIYCTNSEQKPKLEELNNVNGKSFADPRGTDVALKLANVDVKSNAFDTKKLESVNEVYPDENTKCQLMKLESTLEELNSKIQIQIFELEEKENNILELKTNIASLEASLNFSKDKKTSLEVSVSELTKENNSLLSHKKYSCDEVKRLKSKLISQMNEAEQNAAARAKEIAHEIEKVKSLGLELSITAAKLEGSEKRLEKANQEVKEITARYKSTKEALDTERDLNKKLHAEESTMSRKEVLKLSTDLIGLQKVLTDTRNALDSSRTDLNAREEEIFVLKNEVKVLRSKSDHLNKNDRTLKIDLNSKVKEVEDHKSKRALAKHETMTLLRTLDSEREASRKLTESIRLFTVPAVLTQQNDIVGLVGSMDESLDLLSRKLGVPDTPSTVPSLRLTTSGNEASIKADKSIEITSVVTDTAGPSRFAGDARDGRNSRVTSSGLDHEIGQLAEDVRVITFRVERLRVLADAANRKSCVGALKGAIFGVVDAPPDSAKMGRRGGGYGKIERRLT